jgi:hypothetical protein
MSFVALLIGVSVLHCAAESQKNIRTVEIRSGWGGLGTSQNVIVLIERRDDKFVSNGKTVSPGLVQDLVDALSATTIANPDMTTLGIAPEWLKQNAASQHPRAWAQATATTENQQRLFNKSFMDVDLVSKVLPALFRYTKFDDYPFSKVEVAFEDGSKLIAESHSYYVFMLPWKINGKDTFNAGISRAIAGLLPAKSVNRERLAGDGLAAQLTDAVMQSIEREWNLLGSDERAGEALKMLRTTYDIVTAELNPYHHPEYGTATYKGEPEEMNLHATVRRSSFPPDVTDALVLNYANGKVEGVSEFLQSAANYENLALSLPWLNKYIQEHPRVAVRISYVHDKSFGDKAMRVFMADMKLRGREDLIEQVKAQQADIALLIVGNTYSESYWLLFPDKHMMLWRYGGASGLLKWTREDFGKGPCSEYENNYGGCSGREITPEGMLADSHSPQDQVCMTKNQSEQSKPLPEGVDLFPVMSHGKGGFIDHYGKIVIPLCFDAVGDFSDGLARFERDGNWGYIDTSGSVVIQPRFPWAEEFSEGLARVQVLGSTLGVDGRWGFIDKTGAVVIPPEYKEGYGEKSNIGSDGTDDSFHDGLAKVELGGMTGYIDRTGKVAIQPEFTYAYPFSEGLAAVTRSRSGDDGWGYIDTSGRWVVEPQFEWGSSFRDGLASVNRTQKCGYVDRTGKLVLVPSPSPGEKDCAAVWGDFSGGLSRWKFGKKYGFINRTGQVVIKPKYDLAFHFSEGLAAVKIGDKWGYIDTSGSMVITPRKLFRAEDFHKGLAFVTTENRDYGYINRTGKYVWTPTPLYADTK